MTEIFILAAQRSAIGSYGGSLKDTTPIDLAIPVAKDAIEKSGLPADAIQHATYGHVIHTEPRDMYSPRCISIGAGLPEPSPAFQVNRLCGSGLQAIVSATQLIKLGDCDTALAGGVEVMSRGPYILPAQRWGARMGDSTVIDMMTGALHDPFGIGHMGITAENVAADYGISREDMDQFSAQSQARAAHASEAGYFKNQITPVDLTKRRKIVTFDHDDKVNPLARIVAYGFGGVPPRIMGMGPVPASKMALERAGLSVDDLDLVESNEAFAAQACAVSRQLNLDAARVNPNGGAIALGHPVGATGAIIMTKLIHELHRINGRYGMATMCIGGGQGISVVIDAKP